MKTRRVVAGLLASVWAFAFVACENEKTGNGGGMPQNKTIIDLYSFLQQYESYQDGFTIESLQEALAEGWVNRAVLTQNGCEIYGEDIDEVLVFGNESTCTHRFTVSTTRENADCTNFGYATGVCSLCRATQFTFTGALGHDWEVDEMLSEDTARYDCVRCDATKTDEYPLDGNSGNGGVSNVDPTKDVLYIYNQAGAEGSVWLENAAKRFEAVYQNTSFSQGKLGVQVMVETTNMAFNAQQMQSGSYQLYFARPNESVWELAAQGLLKDITDVVCTPSSYGENQSIQDKTYAETQSSCMGADGKYYALPHYEAYAGLTYDLDLFEDKNLFFADGNEGAYYDTQFGGAYFVQSEYDTKSCGPDGEYGTPDDGLPSSLEEFIILCDYMKQEKGITPFTFAGAIPNYADMLVSALWASLAGVDEMNTVYKHQGDVEAVVGFANEPLFNGYDDIKTPITERVAITPNNAYKLYDSAARYYATAILEIAQAEGWFTRDSEMVTTDFIQAQQRFVFNGISGYERVGMLIEGSWWHNEATTFNIFEDYAIYTGSEEKRVAWMSLPTQLYGSVTEGNGREQTLVNAMSSYAFISANVDAVAENICKEFLKFLYTDEELQRFTQETGMLKAVNYQLTEDQLSQMNTFQRSVYSARMNSEVVYEIMDNPTYIANRATLNVAWNSEFYRPIIGGRGYGSFIQAIREGRTAAEIFEATRISQNEWYGMIDY